MSEGIWFMRVYHGVRHTFPTRWLEWLMTFFIIAWGSQFLLSPPALMATGVSPWAGMFFWAPAGAWGVIMMSLGGFRLLALIVNGTFNDTVYSQYSPLMRGMTGGLCGVIWMFVTLSVASAASQGAITYATIVVIEFFASYYVMGEAGDNLRAHRNGRGQ